MEPPSAQQQQTLQQDELFARYLHQSGNHDDVDDLSLSNPSNIDTTNVFEGCMPFSVISLTFQVGTGQRRNSAQWLSDSDSDINAEVDAENITKLFSTYYDVILRYMTPVTIL